MDKQKIIYYIPHSSFFSLHPYGRVTHAIGILNGLVRNGFQVVVIAERGILNFADRLHPAIKYKLLKEYSYWSHLKMLFNISHYIGEGEIFLYRKTIFSFLWRTLFFVIYGSQRNVIVSEVNGFIFDYDERFKQKFMAKWSLLFHKLILKKDNLVYVVNEDLQDQLVTGKFALPRDRVVSIHNGGPDADPIEFRPGRILHLVYFGLVAGYNEWDTILACVRKRPDVYLHIIGGGPELESLQTATTADTNISCYGAMPFETFKNLMKELEGKIVGVLPNRIPNRLGSLSPIKAFDYMSLGMPLIYSNICLKDQAKDGVEGYQYTVGDTASLDSAIDKALVESNYLKIKKQCISNYPKHTWKARMRNLITEIDKCVE